MNAFNGTWNDEQCFNYEMKNGISVESQSFVNWYKDVANKIIEITQAKSFSDLGGGVGAYSLNMLPILNKYYDGSQIHCDYVSNFLPSEKIVQGDFTKMIIDEKELIGCIEVFEHIEDSKLKPFIKTLKAKYIHFSSTPNTTDFDAEWGHINIKNENQWIELFKSCGYELDRKLDFPTAWSLLFIKSKNKVSSK